jgi:Zn-dependent protease with chaperone function
MKLFCRKIISEIDNNMYKIAWISCTVSIISGYIYSSTNIYPITLVSLAFFFISSLIVLWQSIKLICVIIKGKKKRPRTFQEYPKFRSLAREMGVKLNKTHPFVKEKGLDDIGWDWRQNRLILGEDLLCRLTRKQLLAAVVHEFTHGRKRFGLHNWQYLRLFFITVLAVLLIANVMTRLSNGFETGVIIISAFVLVFTTVSHWNEYEADSVASGKISKQAYISVLQKLKPSNMWNVEQLMHPSINQRIAKLNKVKG